VRVPANMTGEFRERDRPFRFIVTGHSGRTYLPT
jgi:hypothetical protein